MIFSPISCRCLSNRISSLIADAYSVRFDLNIPEWRVIAVLGEVPGLTATQLAARTAMDKVAVTRAVQSLVRKGQVRRAASQADGRVTHLNLTARGKRVYADVFPVALEYERTIAEVLTARERSQLDRIVGKLSRRLDDLVQA